MTHADLAVVVMGVSAAGKTTLGARLADDLGGVFIDADDLHSDDARAKMAAGTPLVDDDRWPWLERVSRRIAHEVDSGRMPIVACSALRRVYRDALRRDSSAQVCFLHLHGPAATLEARASLREGHFMPPSLLRSQLETLEPLQADELGTVIDLDAPVEDMSRDASRFLTLTLSTNGTHSC